MADTVYYQWQNPNLLEVIYPLRLLKLRDFLVFFQEIEIWQRYKGKDPQRDFPDKVRAYFQAQRDQIRQAAADLKDLEGYVQTPDITAAPGFQAKFPATDPETLRTINEMHGLYKTYYPRFRNAVQVRYFTTTKISSLEEQIKANRRKLGSKQRGLTVPNLTSSYKALLEKQVAQLETSIQMIDFELDKLHAFLKSFERINVHRQALANIKKERETRRAAAQARLQAMQQQLDKHQAQREQLARRERRLANPLSHDDLRKYFMDDQSASRHLQNVPDADPQLLQRINKSYHNTFKLLFAKQTTPQLQRGFISERMKELTPSRTQAQSALAAASRAAVVAPHDPAKQQALQRARSAAAVLDGEYELLQDFLASVERGGKPADLTQPKAELQREKTALEDLLRKTQTEIGAAQSEINQIDQLQQGGDEVEQMVALATSGSVTVEQLALAESEQYRESLMSLTQEQLIEMIVKKFMDAPERYPLWLQYMVIHFSGMRYQSAHGSWADPRDLLQALASKEVEKRVKDLKDGLAGACQEAYEEYQAAISGTPRIVPDTGAPAKPPLLALAAEKPWQDKLEYHLRRIAPDSPYYRYSALLNLRLDEEEYRISKLSDDDVMQELEAMKGRLPEWMWNEIVRLTELRNKEVRSKDWERLSAEDQLARTEARYAQYRQILDDWKSKNITGWRQAHDRTNKLIVTRAVCNEVAEHCQHIRGHTPAGGLTAKPGWYISRSAEPKLAVLRPTPFFRRIRSEKDLEVGASIFWLNWVRKEPNQWQIARPMAPPGEKDLIEVGKETNARSNSVYEIVNMGDHYRQNYTRPVTVSGKQQMESGTQWLRWLHEATVAAVAETAEGQTVLTYETALPNEDRRQSAIGVFKRKAVHLNYKVTPSLMIGTYAGYLPELRLNVEDTKTTREMMDFNHILRRPNAYTQAQLDAYWAKVTAQARPVSFAMDITELHYRVELAPELRADARVTAALCYQRARRSSQYTLVEPPVALPRGLRLTVGAEEDDESGFMRVVQCDYDPVAEDLYLRAADTLRLPERASDRPVRARRDTRLFRLCGADDRLQRAAEHIGLEHVEPRAIFEPTERVLLGGFSARISTVHKAGRGEGGIVLGERRRQYVLIVHCPQQPSAEGYFVRRTDLQMLLDG